MHQTSSNNAGWKRLFEQLRIHAQIEEFGLFRLRAEQIKKVGGREPRLMTKFDSREQRPRLLAHHGLTILPISNGEYLLLKGDGYCDVPPVGQVEIYDAAKIADLQTIPWRAGIRSEPQAIDTLFMASALRSFIGDESLQLTIRGKLRSNKFSFRFRTDIRDEKVRVDGVQIEIDSGFEGDKVLLLEAKFGTMNSFIIRQLYYPYRNLLAEGIKKEIVLVLLVYSNRVYSVYRFEFADVDSYQSIRLVRQVDYTLEDLKTIPRFADVLAHKKGAAPPGVPFPQADDLSKVFDVTDILAAGPTTKEEIAERFDVDPRQGDYYANAAYWLGLVDKSGHQFTLTQAGREFSKKSRIDRIVEIAQLVSKMPAFSEAAEAFAQRKPLETEEIAEIISRSYGLSGTTPARRASTVTAWIDWLANQLRK